MAENAPTFFLDRGLGSVVVPRRLRAAGWSVVTMDERYGVDRSQEVADVDWVRESSDRGEVLLTKDVAIARRPVEARVVHMCDARVVTMTNAQIDADTMAQWFLRHEDSVMRWATRVPAPFVLGIYKDRVRRLPLAYP